MSTFEADTTTETPQCPGCGYNLTGLEPPLDCPECGHAVPDMTIARLPRQSNKSSKSLKDPMWPAMLPKCPGCSYNLTGLQPPASCPECGFHVDDKTLVLRGVVKADASQSPVRKVLWGLTIVSGVILLYALSFALELMVFNVYLLAAVAVWGVGFTAIIMTSKRDRAGRMAIVFASGGFIALPNLVDAEHEGTAVNWNCVTNIKLKRISPVWYQLQIWSNAEKLLDAGIRCPDHDAKLVYDTLEAFRMGLASGDHATA